MAYSAENLFPSLRPAAAADLRTAVAATLARILRKYRTYQTTRALSALDDRTLGDIGLYRDQILWAARNAALAAEHRIER